jgi:hypothetical protein
MNNQKKKFDQFIRDCAKYFPPCVLAHIVSHDRSTKLLGDCKMCKMLKPILMEMCRDKGSMLEPDYVRKQIVSN